MGQVLNGPVGIPASSLGGTDTGLLEANGAGAARVVRTTGVPKLAGLSLQDMGDTEGGPYPDDPLAIALGASGALDVSIGDVYIANTGTLGSECLNETDFATHAKWARSGGFSSAYTGNKANYLDDGSTHAGTLTQSNANQVSATAIPLGRLCKLSYTVSAVVGTPTCTFAHGSGTSITLTLTAGVQTAYFLSDTSAGSIVFTVSGTVAADAFSLDDVSVKDIQGGNINVGGVVRAHSLSLGGATAVTAIPTIAVANTYLVEGDGAGGTIQSGYAEADLDVIAGKANDGETLINIVAALSSALVKGNSSTLVNATDGTDYFSPSTTLRELAGVAAAQFDKTSDTSLATVTGLTANLATSGLLYKFEAILDVTAGVTGGTKYAVTCTNITSIRYEVILVDNTTNLLTITSRQTTSGGSVGQAGTLTGLCRITGYVLTSSANAALAIQFAQNASNGTASSVLLGSNLVVTQLN